MTAAWGESRFPLAPLGRISEIQLGKMLQPKPATAEDQEVAYLRAGSLATLDSLSNLPTMYASASDLATYAVREGDLLVAEGGDCGQAGLVPGQIGDAIIQNSLHRVRSNQSDIRFLRYVIAGVYGSGWLDVLCNKSTFGHLTREKLAALRVPNPPLEEQRAIADYLDRETARIDALAAAKDALKRALKQKESSWLAGRFEAGAREFGTIRVKHMIAGLSQGWSPQCDDRPPAATEWSVLKAGAVNGGWFRHEERKALPSHTSPRTEYLIGAGDLLINRANGSLDNLGSAAVVPDPAPPLTLLCDKIFRASVNPDIADPRWLAAMLSARPVRDQLLLGVSGADGMANSLPSGVVVNVQVPRAPRDAQLPFLAEWFRLRDDVTQAMNALTRSVDLLREHHHAVITAAVTGQIEVPVAA